MPELDPVREVLLAICLVGGAGMSAVAGLGLLRFPDQLTRMHAATKPQVLGLLLLLIGVGLVWWDWVWMPILVVAWVLQMLTAPVSAHLVGRSGYRTKHRRSETLYVDELADVVASQDDAGRPASESDYRPEPSPEDHRPRAEDR